MKVQVHIKKGYFEHAAISHSMVVMRLTLCQSSGITKIERSPDCVPGRAMKNLQETLGPAQLGESQDSLR